MPPPCNGSELGSGQSSSSSNVDLARLEAALTSLRQATQLSRHYGEVGGRTRDIHGEEWVLPESLMQTAAALTVLGTTRADPNTLLEAAASYAAALPQLHLMKEPHLTRLQAHYRMQQVVHFRRQIPSSGGWFRGSPATQGILRADRSCEATRRPVAESWVTCDVGFTETGLAEGTRLLLFEARLDRHERAEGEGRESGAGSGKGALTALLYLEGLLSP